MEQAVKRIERLCEYLPGRISALICGVAPELLCDLEEIRLRRARPVSLTFRKKTLFLCENGSLSVFPTGAVCATALEMDEMFLKFCKHSVYSFQSELAAGFVTLEGGHRVGICGTAVFDESGAVSGQSDIGTLNIRISREVLGAANQLLPVVTDGKYIWGTLIIAPPKCGKTTILRDLARQLSEQCFRVSLIDERGELASCRSGVPECDVGPCTDVFDAIGKGEGMLRALRTMSPEVIVVDEIVGSREAWAIEEAQGCGVSIIATAHAAKYQDLLTKPGFRSLLASGAFIKVVVLNAKYEIESVHDLSKERMLCRG